MQYNKHYFFKDIFLFVFIIHAMLLALLFICDKAKFQHERFYIKTDQLESTVVFVPLKKHIVQPKQIRSMQATVDKPLNVINLDQYEKKVAALPQKSGKKNEKTAKKATFIKSGALKETQKSCKPVPVSSVKKIQKPVKASTALHDTTKKQKVEKTLKTVKSVESSSKKVEKINVKKQPKVVQSQPPIEKNGEKEVVQNEQKSDGISAIPDQELLPVEKKIEVIKENVQSTHEQDPGLDDDILSDEINLGNISFVGSRDLEKIRMRDQIYERVLHFYKPPVGIAKHVVCELLVQVGYDGKAVRVVVTKSSGSMAHDICARAALLQVTFFKEVYGKEFTIELGP